MNDKKPRIDIWYLLGKIGIGIDIVIFVVITHRKTYSKLSSPRK